MTTQAVSNNIRFALQKRRFVKGFPIGWQTINTDLNSGDPDFKAELDDQIRHHGLSTKVEGYDWRLIPASE